MEKGEQLKRRLSGGIGWLAIAGVVAAWDLKAPETLSAAFERGMDNKHSRPFVLGALAVTCAHLVGAIPERLDPFKAALAAVSHNKIAESIGIEAMQAVNSTTLVAESNL